MSKKFSENLVGVSHNNKATPIILDGKEYSSIAAAMNTTGIGQRTLVEKVKQLGKSSFSEITFEASVKKTFTLKKVKQK